MIPTLTRYLRTLENPEGLCRRLAGAELCRDREGRPVFFVGNSAAVFKIRLGGRCLRLKCYTRPVTADLEAIYGESLLRQELFVYVDCSHGCWVDVVAEEWIEGTTLDETVRRLAGTGDRAGLRSLSERFDVLAAGMLADDRAHGDLKPENILVDREGCLHLIDFDAAFLPAFAGRPSPELGTEAFRHPARTSADFDARLDDYPAALISSALAALSLDPNLLTACTNTDGLLFDPCEVMCGRSAAYIGALRSLAAADDALHYRIARLLKWPFPQLPDAARLFSLTQKPPVTADEIPELFEQGGLWGYRTSRQECIPPLYDCGFEFSEGLAAVRLGDAWHYIDPTGGHVIDASEYDAVKPFRSGVARVRKGERWLTIGRRGETLREEL